MTFVEGDKDAGRVITGFSNFTQAGLIDNLEFNVELKGRADYEFALAKFNELWENAVAVKDRYIETIQNRTWLNNTINPYELYLNFLYEYFKGKNYLTYSTKQEKVREDESQIDQMMYELYGLTPEEIRVVEDSREK